MISIPEIQQILDDPDRQRMEALAQKAAAVTEQYFGRTISLYAPIYLSNYCSSRCTYCGFNSHQRIHRLKLSPAQISSEMERVAQTGIENILLLTGESYQATPLTYLLEAATIARPRFSCIGMEVHPMETEDYRTLFENGVDGITVYQETYDPQRYREVHLAGKKSDYEYRYETPFRAAAAGIRQLSLGILLGLGPVAEDLGHLFQHLRALEKEFPGVEYSLSFPRLRPIKGWDLAPGQVDDVTFLKIICLARTQFPRVGINLSTRECRRLRDHVLGLGVTRISAGSNTSVGGYTVLDPRDQDPQFDVEDDRSVEEIIRMLKARGFDPVLTDWRTLGGPRVSVQGS